MWKRSFQKARRYSVLGPNLEELKALIREEVINSLDFSREISDEEMYQVCARVRE